MADPAIHSRTNGRSQGPPAPFRAAISALAAVSPGLAARGLAELCLRPPRHRAPDHERAALRGDEPLAISHPGGVVRGWRRGSGPAVLLLHGWGGRSGQMSPLAGALVAAGCTAVAIDAPGHGRSSGRVASVPLYAGAIAAAIRELRVRAAVGHSFGGSALAFAVAHGADVGAAVIIGSPATPAVYVDRFCDELRLSSAMRGRLRRRAWRRGWAAASRSSSSSGPSPRPGRRRWWSTIAPTGRSTSRTPRRWRGPGPARGSTPPPASGTGASCASRQCSPTWPRSWWAGFRAAPAGAWQSGPATAPRVVWAARWPTISRARERRRGCRPHAPPSGALHTDS